MSNKTPVAFVLQKIEGLDDYHTLRLIIPGIDGGSAVHLDGQVLHESIEACEELLKRVIAELPKTEFRQTI